MQTKLDQAAQVHTNAYGVKRLGNPRRKQVYPELWRNKQRYLTKDFQVSRVYHYLREVLFARKVNNPGILHFHGQIVYLGRAYQYQTVIVQLDLKNKHFTASNKPKEDCT